NFTLQEGETVFIRKSTAESAVIFVTNNNIYSQIEWYCISAIPLTIGVTESGAKFTASVANEPFKNVREYKVTVVGVTKEDNEKVYGTSFNIKVES
ncbi:hypothetical protein, partial [Treponema sp. R6D11]